MPNRLYAYILSEEVRLATIAEVDPKAPFLDSYYTKVLGGVTPFLGLLHFTLNASLIMLSVKQGGIKYHF